MPTTTNVPFTTPGTSSWTVPAGVNFITLTCKGAAGAQGVNDGPGGNGGGNAVRGGYGGLASLRVPVQAGDVVDVAVGATPASPGGGGGGASKVSIGGTALVIAGGGGGAGDTYVYVGGSSYAGGTGGTGGGSTGGTGGTGGGGGGTGGTGGTQTADGTSGQDALPNNGAVAQGGTGGAGWHVGGSGGTAWDGTGGGGGGGGSSYLATTAPRGATSNGSTTTGGGSASNGSVTISYTTNTAPNPPTVTAPANNAYVDRTKAVTLEWSFSDPDAGDTQSSADVRWRPSGGSTWTTITGAATTGQSYVFPAGTFTTEGQQIEVQVQTYDTGPLASGWGPSSFFTTVTPPASVTITAPAAAATINSLATNPLTWAAVTGQTDYEARRVADDGTGSPNASTVYEDTGIVTSTATSVTFAAAGTHQVGAEHWQVRVRTNGTFWTDWTDLAVTMALDAPPQPTAALIPQPDTASVLVQIGNPAPVSPFVDTVSNDVLRTSPDGSTVRIASGLAVNATYVDYLPGAGVNTYQIVAYSANGATNASA